MTEIATFSETEVVDAVGAAIAWKSPFNIVGARSKRNLGRAVAAWGTVLDVSGLKGIVSYEPEELIVTLRPGTPVIEVAAALAEKGQRLGFDPPDWGPLLGGAKDAGTIGGAISTNANGSGRVMCGAVRDHLLGFRGVNGLGQAFKAGGKVVKNVTGFDIPKLVCGAFGTLCVLTEVTLRVFPKPSRTLMLAARDMAPADGLALLRRIWSSPLESTGLAYANGTALIRLEGEKDPLAEKVSLLRTLAGAVEIQSLADGSDIVGQIASGTNFQNTEHPVWRVMIPPASAMTVISEIGSTLWTADWAGGLLWIATVDGKRLREVVKAAGGHAMLFRADENMRGSIDVFEPEQGPAAALTRSVKAAFDPLNLFNPGRMWPEQPAAG